MIFIKVSVAGKKMLRMTIVVPLKKFTRPD